MRQRLTFLLRTFLWTLALFMLDKIGFMLYNGGAHEACNPQMEISAQLNKKDESKYIDALVEGFSKHSRKQLCGCTEHNKMVVFPKAGHYIGETVSVKLQQAALSHF